MSFTKIRLDESRGQLLAAAGVALGVYIEQEKSKGDGWRDESLSLLYKHLFNEVDDEVRIGIKTCNTSSLVRDAADAAVLSLMILARALEQSGETSK